MGRTGPRREAVCVVCVRLDWVDRRVAVRLFQEPPKEALRGCSSASRKERGDSTDSQEDTSNADSSDEEREGDVSSVPRLGGEYFLPSPKEVQKRLAVERYEQRWPLIPAAELHASSVEHPDCAEWRWLLHTRRVPVCAADEEVEVPRGCSSASRQQRPRCAGVGDAEQSVWMCRTCLGDSGRARPRMPKTRPGE